MSILTKFHLEGKTALVTGCDRGIGQAMAIALAEAGADIVGTSISEDIKTGETQQAVFSLGKKFSGYVIDISDREKLYQFINEVKSNHSIDILVNNAGMILRQPIAEHPDDWWDKVIAVNQSAQFILTRNLERP